MYIVGDTSSICDDCHPNANCVVDHSEQRYRCQCSAGYHGDGLRCVPHNCHEADICDANAVCAQDSFGNNVCTCNAGYRGRSFCPLCNFVIFIDFLFLNFIYIATNG